MKSCEGTEQNVSEMPRCTDKHNELSGKQSHRRTAHYLTTPGYLHILYSVKRRQRITVPSELVYFKVLS